MVFKLKMEHDFLKVITQTQFTDLCSMVEIERFCTIEVIEENDERTVCRLITPQGNRLLVTLCK